MAQPARIVYRSRSIQFPLLAAMEAADAWERAGIELQSLEFVSGAAKSDPMLIEGKCDFVFGSHISPYLHKAAGHPLAYLGQTVNWVDDVLVSRTPVTTLADVEGKRLAEKGDVSAQSAGHANHTAANHLLYLRRAGVDLETIDFVKTTDRISDVESGRADMAFCVPPDDVTARERGLYILDLDPLPMVYATTLTTLWPTVRANPELCFSVSKAVAIGIAYLKSPANKDAMWKVMQEKVGPELGIESEKTLRYLQRRTASMLEATMYPRADAITNAFELALMEDADLAGKVNPLSLWQLQFVRDLEESGFLDELYANDVPQPGGRLEESRTWAPQ